MIARNRRTRAALVFGVMSLSVATAWAEPSIESAALSPIAKSGLLTITGRGFGADNIVSIDGKVVQHAHIESVAAIACTISPSCKPGFLQTLEIRLPRGLKPGTHSLVVESGGGASNSVVFSTAQ